MEAEHTVSTGDTKKSTQKYIVTKLHKPRMKEIKGGETYYK